jgi:uncharacterized protein YmfQ (DUF2313 family)
LTSAPIAGGDATASAILAAVEHQLTRYFGAMAARADAVQQAGEAGRAQLVAHFQEQIDNLRTELDRAQQANDHYDRALQAAVEERLTEFAANQHWRFSEVEGRLERVTGDLALAVPAQIEAASAPLQDRFERTTELMASRIEELQKAARRFDEQSSALVQHVNDTTATLSKRIDDSGRMLNSNLDERTLAVSQRLDESTGAMRQYVVEQAATFGRRIEENDTRVVDRMLALEERVNEHTGTRLAAVEATIGRISGGIDEAIVALSQRVIELENNNYDVLARIDEMAQHVAKVDTDAIAALREQMSSAVGEAMLVRIELERVGTSTSEQFDKVNVRMAEVEATLTETFMDVSTAVQLERLEEIERALVELDPKQFLRRDDPNAPVAATRAQPAEADRNGMSNGSHTNSGSDMTSSESALTSW